MLQRRDAKSAERESRNRNDRIMAEQKHGEVLLFVDSQLKPFCVQIKRDEAKAEGNPMAEIRKHPRALSRWERIATKRRRLPASVLEGTA